MRITSSTVSDGHRDRAGVCSLDLGMLYASIQVCSVDVCRTGVFDAVETPSLLTLQREDTYVKGEEDVRGTYALEWSWTTNARKSVRIDRSPNGTPRKLICTDEAVEIRSYPW